MFEWMNRHKKDIMTYTLWLVIPSFIVLYGYGECRKPQRLEWATRINGESVTQYEWQQWIDNIQNRMQQYGQDVKRDELRGQALDAVITLALNREKAETYGLQTVDEEVSKAIHEMQYFKDQAGNFNINAYRGILSQIGKTPVQFEEEQRDVITRTKLRTAVSSSLFPSDGEIKQLEGRESQKIYLDYLAFEPSRYVDDVTPTAEGLQKFFDDNREDYRIPDQRGIAYAQFFPAKYIAEATYTEYQLNRFFDENRENYRVPDAIRVDYLTYAPKAFEEKAQATEEEIQKHYEENQGSFMSDPQTQIRYIVQPMADLMAAQPVPDQEIKDYYDKNIKQYTHGEEAKARHILLRVTAGLTAEEDAAVNERLIGIRKEIEGGLPFEEAAKKYSADRGSAEKGGDLGYFGKGRMVPPFEKAAFELPLGQISEPVKTDFGYHLILVENRRGEGTEPLESVHDEILQTLQKQKAMESFRSEMEILPSLDALNGRYGIKTTDWFSRGAELPGLSEGESSMIVAAAFRKTENATSAISVVGYPNMNNVFVIERMGFKESQQQTLDEAREKVLADLKTLKAEELAQAAAQADAERIKSASLTLDAIATERGLKVETSDFFSQNDQFVRGFGMRPTELMTKAFALTQGEIGGPVKTQMGTQIIRLAAREPEHIPEMKEALQKVQQDCLKSKAETLAQLEARKFSDMLYNQQLSLEIGAASDQIECGTTGLFSAQEPIPVLGQQPAMSQAVFQLEKVGDIGEPVPLTARPRSMMMQQQQSQEIESYCVAQLKEIKGTYLPELAEVKEKVEKDYRLVLAEEVANRCAAEALEEIKKAIASSQPVSATKAVELKQFEDANNDKTVGKGGVYRGPYEITGGGMVSGISGRPFAFVKTAMALEPGQVSGIVTYYREKPTKEGEIVRGPMAGAFILQVLGKKTAAEESAATKKQAGDQLTRRLQSIAYEAWIEEVSAAATIEYNKEIISPEEIDKEKNEATMEENKSEEDASS